MWFFFNFYCIGGSELWLTKAYIRINVSLWDATVLFSIMRSQAKFDTLILRGGKYSVQTFHWCSVTDNRKKKFRTHFSLPCSHRVHSAKARKELLPIWLPTMQITEQNLCFCIAFCSSAVSKYLPQQNGLAYTSSLLTAKLTSCFLYSKQETQAADPSKPV